jgi:hypothetical protein
MSFSKNVFISFLKYLRRTPTGEIEKKHVFFSFITPSFLMEKIESILYRQLWIIERIDGKMLSHSTS